MVDISSNTEFFALLRGLIGTWCDRHALRPLSLVLGPYMAFNGLTDSWGELVTVLKAVRAQCRKDIPEAEMDTVRDLIRAAEAVISRHLNPN